MLKQRYKIIIITIFLTGIAAIAFAQVNEAEIQDLPPVVFINYEGPHTRVDTREEIRQIGVVLGQVVQQRESGIAPELAAMNYEERRAYSYRFDAGASGRYWVIHSVSGPEDSKLDADVFGLGVDVGVDHIRNLRVILQGYLQAAYSYSASDALLLAEYITIYNAVYRGNWDYFTSRYKTPIISNLTRDRAGLSIRYDEWPGRTLMLIPLGIGVNSVDTSVITDSRVIEEMRREDDQGIPQRQQMVDLIERQAEQASQQAQDQRQTAAQEQARVTEERQQVQQERQTVQEARQQGQITEQQASEAQQELDRREQDLDRREQAAQEQIEEADRLDQRASDRFEDAQQMREDIARDQQAAITPPAQETVVYGILIETAARNTSIPGMVDTAVDAIQGNIVVTTGRIVHLNAQTGRQIHRSPLIHVRTVTNIGGKIIAVAGEARSSQNQAVRLVEINQNTLEIAKQGNDDIRMGSLIWVNGSDLYAIVADGGASYIGRFNTNLDLQSKSSIRVHSEAGVSIIDRRLLTQREDGSPLALNPADLSEIRY